MNSYELNLRKSFLETSNEHKQFFKPHSQKLDVDDRHDLRVMMRRLDAMVRLMKDYIPRNHYSEVRKVLKKLIRRLGKFRERDVLHEFEKEFHVETNVYYQKNVPLKEFISKKEFQTLENELNWIRHRLEERTEIPINGRAGKLLTDLKEWKKIDDLHEFRIFMKRVRYTLESLSLPVQKLKTLQDLLGEIHDLEIFEKEVGDNPKVHHKLVSLKKQFLKRKTPAVHFAKDQLDKIIH